MAIVATTEGVAAIVVNDDNEGSGFRSEKTNDAQVNSVEDILVPAMRCDEAIACEFMASISVSDEDVNRMLNVAQRHPDGRPHADWIDARRHRLTASRFASACGMEGARACPQTVLQEMMQLPEADSNQAGRWGIQKERTALRAYVLQRRRELACIARGEDACQIRAETEPVSTSKSDCALNGSWHTEGRPLIIHEWVIYWPDDTKTELNKMHKDTYSMCFHGEVFHADLVDGSLYWSDGDVWTRDDSDSSTAADDDDEVADAEEANSIYPKFGVREVGLCVWRDEPWLAASPDGICIEDDEPVGILEVKTARAWNDRFECDPPVDWLYQINGCMRIASAALNVPINWCDLFYWSPHRNSCRRFPFDEKLWERTMYPALRSFYFATYLARMVEKEHVREARAQKMKNKHAKKRANQKRLSST